MKEKIKNALCEKYKDLVEVHDVECLDYDRNIFYIWLILKNNVKIKVLERFKEVDNKFVRIKVIDE